MILHKNVSLTSSLHSWKIHLCEFIWLLGSPHSLVTWGWQYVYYWYLSHVRDLLQGTWEHQTLHAGLGQCILPDFNLLLISHNKIVMYICMCLPSEDQKGLQQELHTSWNYIATWNNLQLRSTWIFMTRFTSSDWVMLIPVEADLVKVPSAALA